MPRNPLTKIFSRRQDPEPAPPEWAPAPEISHQFGLINEAERDDYEAAKAFCETTVTRDPRLISTHVIERIKAVGCRAWGLDIPRIDRFKGEIHNPEDAKDGLGVVHVETFPECGDTCLMSNLPLVAGMYDYKGKLGAYYEIKVIEMDSEGGVIALGTACHPYPQYRLPGWNRDSAGLHLDDMRKFFEDSHGGRDYLTNHKMQAGDVFGCGFEFGFGRLFFTYNGEKLPPAFEGLYMPHKKWDVHAAVGVSGAVKLEINFGGGVFRWPEGNKGSWRAEGYVGDKLAGEDNDELPAYEVVES
ncbi:hypothetical protein H0H87_009328 [Tephrocybe sp. NHM501043]|nr:hypothetical protein H0H87_009328 [Tephrocybe sp. NHM501043]